MDLTINLYEITLTYSNGQVVKTERTAMSNDIEWVVEQFYQCNPTISLVEYIFIGSYL